MPATLDLPAGTRMIHAFAAGLHSDLLRELANAKADDLAQARYEELAEKNTEGQLSPTERDELENIVQVSDVLSALKTEARVLLHDMKLSA